MGFRQLMKVLPPGAAALATFLFSLSVSAFARQEQSLRLAPRQALLLPGVSALLPAGTTPYEGGGPAFHPILVEAAMATPATTAEGGRRIALLLLEPRKQPENTPGQAGVAAPQRMRARLLLLRQQKGGFSLELDRPSEAPQFISLELGFFGPGRSLAVAVHWADGPGPHEGLVEVWPLGSSQQSPRKAYSSNADGFYFKDVEGDGQKRMVLYASEPDSLVCLPQVLEWQEGRLVPCVKPHARLDQELLTSYDEVLDGYRAAGETGDPPRMVMDVALSKGRLLEQRGMRQEAFLAYQTALDLIPGGLVVQESEIDSRREILERAAEARRRAAALYGLPAGR